MFDGGAVRIENSPRESCNNPSVDFAGVFAVCWLKRFSGNCSECLRLHYLCSEAVYLKYSKFPSHCDGCLEANRNRLGPGR